MSRRNRKWRLRSPTGLPSPFSDFVLPRMGPRDLIFSSSQPFIPFRASGFTYTHAPVVVLGDSEFETRENPDANP